MAFSCNTAITGEGLSEFLKSTPNIEILELSNMILELRDNVEISTFPNMIKLDRLKLLVLYGNDVLTDEALAEFLKYTPNLSMLDLRSTNFSTLPIKVKLLKLRKVVLRGNRTMTAEAVIEFLKYMPNLQVLDLQCTAIKRLPYAFFF